MVPNHYVSEKGKQTAGHYVHLFPAWDPDLGALWNERYRANSEEELQERHNVGPWDVSATSR